MQWRRLLVWLEWCQAMDPELGKVSPDRVNHRGLLKDEPLASAVKHQVANGRISRLPVICHLQCSFGPPYQNRKIEVLFECLYHASCMKLVLVGCAKPRFRTAPGRFCAHQEAHDY